MKKIVRTEQETVDFLKQRKAAYRQIPQIVLEDLAVFCRAGATCFNADQRIHAALEGRREVWLRIQDHINLSAAELYDLFAGRPIMSLLEQEEETNG